MRNALTIAFLLLLSTLPLAAQREGTEPLRSESTPDGWRVTMRNHEPRLLDMPGEPPYAQVRMPGYELRFVPGLPALPVRVLEFALPEGMSLVLVEGPRVEETVAGELAPFGGAETPAAVAPHAELLPVTVRDGRRFGALRLSPARYDARARTLSWLREARYDLRLVAEMRATATPRTAGTPAFANGRASGPAPLRAGEEYLRITTRAEGLYRLTYEDAVAAGWNPAGIDPALLRLTLRGEEVPIDVSGASDGRLDPGDAVTFFAPRKAGEGDEYFDEWSDDNVFLLSWTGAPGTRWGESDVAPSSHPAAVPLDVFPMLLHLEEDREYHRGDFEYTDMLVTDRVTGEGWMWSYLLKRDAAQRQDSIRTRFALQSPANRAAVLRVRARGASRDTSLLRATLNGSLVGEARIAPYAWAMVEFSVPAGLLRGTDNELVITNPGIVLCPPENPACSIERFFVDWAELRYSATLASAATPIALHAAARYAGAEVPALSRVTLPQGALPIQGFDRANGNRLANIERAGAEARMALDSAGRYFLYTEADILSPIAVTSFRVPDYVGGTAQADYLLVTHRAFREQAERLARHRRDSDGYAVLVADVDELYDAYGHGHKSPRAIRAFVEDMWNNAPAPRPRFLLLLGDASYDAKQRKANSSKVDYIPAYGNPVSDNYYAFFNEMSFDVTPALSVGRIPAESPAQADAVIDKILAYETAPVREWDDRILFSVGGENPFEQDVMLRPIIDALSQLWVEPNCIETRLIVKKTLDFVSYDDLDTLIHEVNQGVSWFFFAGHGGTRVIDVGVERPDIFDNEDKYIFFVTMSCNTAHFAEPFETGLNERFVMSPRNGAVTALGTSGLGILNIDYVLSRGMFRGLIDSAARTYGEIVMLGKRELTRAYGIGDQASINTINQVTLLGDPATRIPLARTPEFAVRESDLSTEPGILVEQSAAVIRTRLHNDGLCAGDSVAVLLTVRGGGTEHFQDRRLLPPFAVDTLLEWRYDFAGIDGSAEIRVTIDPDDAIVEKDESNNSAALAVNVLPRGLAQIFPLDRAVLGRAAGRIDVLLANPTFVPDVALAPEAEIEFARDAAFSSGRSAMTAELGTVFTAIEAPLPAGDGVWYWRARLRTSAGPESWSATRSFTLESSATADEQWRQSDAGQFAMTQTEALEDASGGGLRLGERALELEAASGGFNGPFKHTILRLGGTQVSTDRRGFNLAVVEPVYGRLVDTLNFDTYEGRAVAAQMAASVNGIPDDHVLMVAVRDDANGYPPTAPDGTNISPELRQALAAFGARLIDSVGFRDSYVLVGRRSDPSDVREQHFVLGTAVARDTLRVRATEGVLRTPVIGPANSVATLVWNGEAGSPSAAVDLRLYALRAGAPGAAPGTTAPDTLLGQWTAVAPGSEVSLAALNPLPSAFLRLEARLRDESGVASPVLRSLGLGYVSRFPELGITSQVVESEPDSVLEGEPVTVRATVYNGGRIASAARSVRLSVPGSGILLEQALPAVAPDPDGGVEVEFELPTAGLRGSHGFELGIDPAGEGTEYYHANNVYSKRFASGRDGEAPLLDVTFDGAGIVNGDFVAPSPLIEISLRDHSPLPVTDTSSVQLFLDGRRIWLKSDARVSYEPGSGEEKLRIRFTPELEDGLHFLAVSGKDASGNAADTIPYQVRFNVSRQARFDQVIPYPSPTAGPADFTFRVIGAEAPESVRLKLYTVAGRLIREIDAAPGDLRVGFNRIAWDGRDADGDALANGVYFFKVVLSLGGENVEYVGRFAVLR